MLKIFYDVLVWGRSVVPVICPRSHRAFGIFFECEDGSLGAIPDENVCLTV